MTSSLRQFASQSQNYDAMTIYFIMKVLVLEKRHLVGGAAYYICQYNQSQKDAANYTRYVDKLDEIVDIINPFIDNAPPEGFMDAIKLGLKLKKPKKQTASEIFQMMTAPVAT